MLTIDRVAGSALALVALGIMEETWRLSLPLGSLRNPGPGYAPVLLALILLMFGGGLAAFGVGSIRFATLAWTEWRHAVAILGVCAFAAFALERLGYRLTVAAMLAFLLGVVERQGLLVTVVLMIAFSLGTFFMFDTLLRVPLPRGPGGF
jgi:Tripartite tricarboxylate transporter TctB family